MRMSEEQVTKSIMRWLVAEGWEIVSYDFPQSGTGRALRPSNASARNLGTVIPDIIAYRDGTVLIMEDKDRLVKSDFEKQQFIKTSGIYNKALTELLGQRNASRKVYGIGLPQSDGNAHKAQLLSDMVDVVLLVDEDGSINCNKK